jgi:hypothetical protein
MSPGYLQSASLTLPKLRGVLVSWAVLARRGASRYHVTIAKVFVLFVLFLQGQKRTVTIALSISGQATKYRVKKEIRSKIK